MTRPTRVWATSKPGRYVGDGHPDAVSLAAGPADALPKDFDPALFDTTVAVVVDEAASDGKKVESDGVPEKVAAAPTTKPSKPKTKS